MIVLFVLKQHHLWGDFYIDFWQCINASVGIPGIPKQTKRVGSPLDDESDLPQLKSHEPRFKKPGVPDAFHGKSWLFNKDPYNGLLLFIVITI